jgi:hypothetical protein
MAGDLVLYDEMCRAIGAAYEVDEVKEIRDKAVALEHYFRLAKNPEPERRACEIRLRAERKAGQLQAVAEKAKASPGNQYTGHMDRGTEYTGPKTLAELGITKRQSSDWQKLASVPDDVFESALASPTKPSTKGILAQATPAATVKPMDPQALWLWGRLRDFERDGMLDRDQAEILAELTDGMRADVLRLALLVCEWLEGLSDGEGSGRSAAA